ncbi:MAG: DUF1289 domain-containing protein [Gammaproteobacteria bacterium]
MDKLPSPCVAVCELNASGTFCTGCGRTTDEIARWRTADPAQQLSIVAAAGKRLADYRLAGEAHPAQALPGPLTPIKD